VEQKYLPLFDRVWVCSEQDRVEIGRQYGCNNIAMLPNAIRIPETFPARENGEIFTLLFVGNLEYYPNEDAAVFLCSEVLPELRKRAGGPFRIVVAGRCPLPRVQVLSHNPEVTITGPVPDIGNYYHEADVAVTPLRAGGGTRIKVLEAFGYRRPVVSTPLGAEGLMVTHGSEILIADTPSELADTCLLLRDDRLLARALATNAFEWVKAHHTSEQVKQSLRRYLNTLLLIS
jgi:glycosyltransferase involved in cell wall biosynthesis